jgi:hypothetical protein
MHQTDVFSILLIFFSWLQAVIMKWVIPFFIHPNILAYGYKNRMLKSKFFFYLPTDQKCSNSFFFLFTYRLAMLIASGTNSHPNFSSDHHKSASESLIRWWWSIMIISFGKYSDLPQKLKNFYIPTFQLPTYRRTLWNRMVIQLTPGILLITNHQSRVWGYYPHFKHHASIGTMPSYQCYQIFLFHFILFHFNLFHFIDFSYCSPTLWYGWYFFHLYTIPAYAYNKKKIGIWF